MAMQLFKNSNFSNKSTEKNRLSTTIEQVMKKFSTTIPVCDRCKNCLTEMAPRSLLAARTFLGTNVPFITGERTHDGA
jgi:hypothetical protein